ncbi:MAG: hypothetical protein GC184_11660 [Rhizobiales bacterium]|nr:hypothetical protein [Hyphomicrobiales bacterium]
MFEEPIRKRNLFSLTPLIDVVFQLLIFFMLTTSFLQSQTLTVVTPAESKTQLPEDSRVVEIWLMGNGSMKVAGKPTSPETLSDDLKQAVGTRKDITVTILAENGSKTQALIQAIEAARGSGAASVGTARVEKLER